MRLRFYRLLDRFGPRGYRGKVLATAFVGIHVPLIVLALYLALQAEPDWGEFRWTVGVTLAATLGGVAATLWGLDGLLKPVRLTSRALESYRDRRHIEALPSGFRDEVGVLMTDAGETIAKLERLISALEWVDEETGMANRKSFLREVERMTRRGGSFGVAVIRFADLERMEDAVGSGRAAVGVRALGDRLLDAASAKDAWRMGRVSTSEFAVILDRGRIDEPGALAAVDLMSRLRGLIASLVGEVEVAGMTVLPEMRGGLAVFPSDDRDPDALLDHASTAARRGGADGPVALHSAEARSEAEALLRLEGEIRRAIVEEEFDIHQQPIVCLNRGKVVGAEALVRWNHPRRGVLSPGEFVPPAEAAGLMGDVGMLVLRMACERLAKWSAQGLDLCMAVNLSADQFENPNLCDIIRRETEAAGVDPARLEVELTETMAISCVERSQITMRALRDLGVGIAIDDFGTGYSGLSHLQYLPLTKLKIDREFVRDVHERPQAQAICRSVIHLAQGLGMEVQAEGVEKEEELAWMRKAGCTLIQGFLFATPVSAIGFWHAVRGIESTLERVLDRT